MRLGDIKESTVAARAGLRKGDVVLSIGDLEVAPAPGMVQAVVDKIRCVCERVAGVGLGHATMDMVCPL